MRIPIGPFITLLVLAACAGAPPATAPADFSPQAATPLPPRPPDRQAESQGDQIVRRVQERLKALGYDPGPVDGLPGQRTAGAVAAARSELDLPDLGRTARLAQALDAALAERTRAVQAQLADLGYAPGPRDGKPGPRTWRALARFQADHGLPRTRTLSAALVRQLASRARDTDAAKASDEPVPGPTMASAAGLPSPDAEELLQPGAAITVSIATIEGEQRLQLAVDPDGSVEIPELGRFQASGKPVFALEKAIAVALLDRYLAALRITIEPASGDPPRPAR